MKNAVSVPALEKTIAIIEHLEKNINGATISELSYALNIPKSSVHSIVTTLANYEYLGLKENSKCYILGAKFLSLAASVEKNINLVTISYPYMKILRDLIDETVKISVKNKNTAVVVAKIEAEKEFHANPKIGSHSALHAGAAGKILLAYTSEEDQEKYCKSPLEVFTTTTIADSALLLKELKRIKQNGYAEDMGEHFENIRALACPIFNHRNRVVASISVAYLATTNESNNKKKLEILPHLHSIAIRISKALGSEYSN